MKQPPQKATYLSDVRTRANDVMNYGKQIGRITKVVRIDRAELAGIQGVITDAVNGKAEREITHTLFSDKRSDRAVTVYLRLPEASYQKRWPLLRQVLDSVVIDLEKMR